MLDHAKLFARLVRKERRQPRMQLALERAIQIAQQQRLPTRPADAIAVGVHAQHAGHAQRMQIRVQPLALALPTQLQALVERTRGRTRKRHRARQLERGLREIFVESILRRDGQLIHIDLAR